MIELLIVILIGSILLASVTALFVHQTRVMALNEDRVDMEQNLRVGMDLLVRDVRLAGLFTKDEIPPFRLGALDCNGDGTLGDCSSADAVSVSYSEQEGLTIEYKSPGANVNLFYCPEVDVRVPGGPLEPLSLYFSDTTNHEEPTITNNQVVYNSNGCGAGPECSTGGCNYITIPASYGGFVPDLGGHIWSDLNEFTYFVSQDHDCDLVNDGDEALIRSADGTCSIVAFGITDLSVTYLDEDNNPAASPADVRRVTLRLEGRTRNQHSVGGTQSYRTKVMNTAVLVRNLAF